MALRDEALQLSSLLNEALPVWRAFLALFRFIEETPNGKFGWLRLGSGAVSGVEFDSEVITWNDRLRQVIADDLAINWSSEVAGLRQTLEEISNGDDISAELSKRLVIALRVFDEAFRGVHPAEAHALRDGFGYVELRTRIRQGKPLFEAFDRLAYPKPRRLITPELRGQGRLTDALTNVAIVRKSVELQVINEIRFSDGVPGPEGFSKIGVIPTISSHDELVWTKEPNNQYSVKNDPELQDRIHRRVMDALDALLAEGTEIILMPELVASESLEALLREELERRSDAGQFTPCVILAGTKLALEGARVRNSATVLDKNGEIAWRQNKLHAYTFTVPEQVRAGHPLGLEDLVDRMEAIDFEPRTLYVVDISLTQRVTILTCEDFVQPEPHRSTVSDIVATTILVPIMSCARASENAGWIHDAAMAYIGHPGSTSIVANSGALLAGAGQGWQFGHVAANPRVQFRWRSLGSAADSPLAWLADMPRPV